MEHPLWQSFVFLAGILPLMACGSLAPENPDPFIYLEEIEGTEALNFARNESDLTLKRLKSSKLFPELEADLREVMLAQDRLPSIDIKGHYIYNFWNDMKHVRGVWRRTTFKSYKSASPKWETVLDLDQLAKDENENWVWGGAHCLGPEFQRCLVYLSRGGKDASVVREFNLTKKIFVPGGFSLPEAKHYVSWIDHDHIYVGTDFGAGSLTTSGYPMISKKWARGTPLSEAPEVIRGQPTDVGVSCTTVFWGDKRHHLCSRSLSFFTREYRYSSDGEAWFTVPIPQDADLEGIFKGEILFSLKTDLKVGSQSFKAGSLLSIPIDQVLNSKDALPQIAVWFVPTEMEFFNYLVITKSHALLGTTDKVIGRLYRLDVNPGSDTDRLKIKRTPVVVGDMGVTMVSSANAFTDQVILSYEDFLTPPALYLWNPQGPQTPPLHLKSAPQRFNSKALISEQYWAKSKDGTMVPYFVVRPKDLAFVGKAPTLLYGYGGFGLSLLPRYLNSRGKAWLERGGVYVLANIRGGGELGPSWHLSAKQDRRQNAFDDFISVAEDLVSRKITSPKHLGIEGGSNGGLLTAVMLTQRPDLFNAVISSVPLTDMLRYHKLLAGASWMEEYGNPDDTKMRSYLLSYSPYHNIKKDQAYPVSFFTTSTKDDRVHPAHARKMVARLKEMGHPVLYYENIEGGHGGAANLEQYVLINALEYTYLWEQLR